MYIKLIIASFLFISPLFSQSKINLEYIIFSQDIPNQNVRLEDASNYCEMLTLYGLSDWQLPNDKELSSQKNKTAFWSSDDESSEESKVLLKALCIHHKKTLRECYKFDKKSFKQSLKPPQDIIVEANELKYQSKDNHSFYIWFAQRDGFNAKKDIDFSCENEENASSYSCYSEEDRGEITTYLREDKLYLKINRINMSDDLETSLANAHYIRSRSSKFAIGEKIACDKTTNEEKIILQRTVEDDLLNASRRGDINGILSALDNGADIDATDNHKDTALSIGMEYPNIVKLLLNYDASVELERDSMLRVAIENGNLEILQLLIDNGLKPSLDGLFSEIINGKFELEELFIRGDNKIVRLLIKNGADVEVKDKNGYRPIEKAILAKDLALFKTLIRYHAKLDKKQKDKICQGNWAEGCISL
ncbi:MAG: ankyrin repeat domain-containing protein [Sulfurovum sp.]